MLAQNLIDRFAMQAGSREGGGANRAHGGDGNETDQHRAPEHSRAEPRAHNAAPLIGVEFENITDQQNQHGNEEEECDDRQAREDDDLLGGGWFWKLRIESVKGS